MLKSTLSFGVVNPVDRPLLKPRKSSRKHGDRGIAAVHQWDSKLLRRLHRPDVNIGFISSDPVEIGLGFVVVPDEENPVIRVVVVHQPAQHLPDCPVHT